MTEEVARALCKAAGRSTDGKDPPEARECIHCPRTPDGRLLPCVMWPAFRHEAKEAIIAAHEWHKRERRWPAYVK